jgi:SAM-dependent methyltransferase
MTGYDIGVIRQAGFEIIEEEMIRYSDDEFARGYLSWGFNSSEEQIAEAQFALEQMGLAAGSSVLDIGCGNGTASVCVAQRGMKVMAVDISPVFIEAAEELERKSGLSEAIAWTCADFFAFQCPPHDAALLLDPGMPITTSEFASKMSEVVKTDGMFFLRYKGGINARMSLSQSKWSCPDGQAVFALEQHRFDQQTGRFVDEWVTIDFPARTVRVRRMERRAVLFPDFVDMMSAHGFSLKGTWGDLKGSPVTDVSRLYALFAKV